MNGFLPSLIRIDVKLGLRTTARFLSKLILGEIFKTSLSFIKCEF